MRFDDTAIQGILDERRVIGRTHFPGSKTIEIGLRVISDFEIDTARFQAQIYLEHRCKRAQLTLLDFANIDPEGIEREQQRQTLLVACVDAESEDDDPRPFFAHIEQVRGLDSVLIAQLWDAYTDFTDSISPRLNLSEEEVADLVASLKDEREAKALLAAFDRDTLQSLLRTMAAELLNLATGKSDSSQSAITTNPE